MEEWFENHFMEQGKGETLILLHGNGEESSYFEKQIEEFSRYYRVIAIDTCRHGKTLRGRAPFTIRQFAQDLKAFMDQHNIVRANLLGFSDGANIAMIFAMKYPDRVDRLILDGGNLTPDGVRSGTQIPIEIGYRMASFFKKLSPKARTNAELLGLMVNDPNINPEDLTKIQAPTLVLAGTRDVIKASHTKAIAKAIPDSRLVFITGDHYVVAKNPQTFNAAVLYFLKPEITPSGKKECL